MADEYEGYEEGEADEYGEEEEEELPIVIIDNGSGTCKAGLSDAESPSAIFPEIAGRPRKSAYGKLPQDAVYFGDDVLTHRNQLAMTYPLENGIIENFELMEQLWEYTFLNKLGVEPHKHSVLLTEPPYNPKPNREKMVEIMFETFGVESLNVSIQGVLALLGQGRTTGLVLDSGEGVTHTIPIFDGFGMPHCINRIELAGRELNTLLGKLIAQDGISMSTTEEHNHLRIIKEKHCYCALEPDKEFPEPVSYKLPDGRDIHLGDHMWKCPEALFNPSLVGLEAMGVGGLVWESISKSEIDLRKNLLSNIVLSGGSTMFPGFKERLTRELQTMAPTASKANIRIVTSEDPKIAVWRGAQVFASLRSMQEDQWMTLDDYDEYGASFIHDKIAVRYN